MAANAKFRRLDYLRMREAALQMAAAPLVTLPGVKDFCASRQANLQKSGIVSGDAFVEMRLSFNDFAHHYEQSVRALTEKESA